jgi:hypothetical protein
MPTARTGKILLFDWLLNGDAEFNAAVDNGRGIR